MKSILVIPIFFLTLSSCRSLAKVDNDDLIKMILEELSDLKEDMAQLRVDQ